MKKTLALYIALLSFSSTTSAESNSWIDGIRSGRESLKVTIGPKLFYRRIIPQENQSPDETCEKALEKVKEDLQNDSIKEVIIPFTLEYLLFDKKYKDCAVTISIRKTFMDKISEIKILKDKHEQEYKVINKRLESEKKKSQEMSEKIKSLEQFISSNAHLVKVIKERTSIAQEIQNKIKSDEKNASDYFLTGMDIENFTQITKKRPNINIDFSTPCRNSFGTTYHSLHGTNLLCWNGRHQSSQILGMCNIRNNQCYTRDPD